MSDGFCYTFGMSKTVLFFCGERNDIALSKYAGICAFGRRHKWNVRFIHYRAGAESFRDSVRTWHPDGVITDNTAFASTRASGVPTVFLDADGGHDSRLWPGVFHDPRAAARLAAAEFARLGLLNIAYLPPAEEHEWSDERLDAFRKALQPMPQRLKVFPKRRAEDVTATYLARLREWARALPRPCGVFAANDVTADILLSVCPAANVKVPHDLAVIGVDDTAGICENAFPPLTSIAPAFRDSGRIAAEILDMLMSGQSPVERTVSFGVLGITRRESTQRLYGRATELRNMRDLIHREACNGLKARDVFARLKGSRRNAEIQFKATVGRTIRDEITNVRLRQAKRLLLTTLTLAEIASRCGYRSSSHLRKVFERRMKTTMGAWRRAHRPGSSRDNQPQ